MSLPASKLPHQDHAPCIHGVAHSTRGLPGYQNAPGRPPKFFLEAEHEYLVELAAAAYGMMRMTRAINEYRRAAYGAGAPTVSTWRVRQELLAMRYALNEVGQWAPTSPDGPA